MVYPGCLPACQPCLPWFASRQAAVLVGTRASGRRPASLQPHACLTPSFTTRTRLAGVQDDLGCVGTETSLASCRFNSSINCVHAEDVGVICVPASKAPRNRDRGAGASGLDFSTLGDLTAIKPAKDNGLDEAAPEAPPGGNNKKGRGGIGGGVEGSPPPPPPPPTGSNGGDEPKGGGHEVVEGRPPPPAASGDVGGEKPNGRDGEVVGGRPPPPAASGDVRGDKPLGWGGEVLGGSSPPPAASGDVGGDKPLGGSGGVVFRGSPRGRR